MDNRGVTEVIGFVLVFSLVLATIGLVYVGGLSSLDDSRDAERLNNAERAFDVLADNSQTMARGGSPNRATEISLSEAQLSVETRTRSNVSVANESMQNADGTPITRSRPIRYSTGGETSIVYEFGAVLREQEDGARMIREPDFVFSEERTTVRYIAVRGGEQNVGGSTTVLVRGELRSNSIELHSGDHENVTYQMTTSETRADAWIEYFESELEGMDGACSREPDGAETVVIDCTFETDTVYVARSEIDVQLSN